MELYLVHDLHPTVTFAILCDQSITHIKKSNQSQHVIQLKSLTNVSTSTAIPLFSTTTNLIYQLMLPSNRYFVKNKCNANWFLLQKLKLKPLAQTVAAQ